MTAVIGLGAGGHAKVVLDVIRLVGGFDIVGLLDANPARHGATVSGVRVLGDDSMLPDLAAQGVRHAFVGVGSTTTTAPRRRLFDLARQHGFELVTVIHPSALVSPSVDVGAAVTIMAAAVIQAASTIGVHVIVNTGALIEHDCVIGDHAHIATGARLAGSVTVGEGAHVGIGAVIRQGITIGRGAIVGAGAVVIEDVPPHVVVVGVPARVLRTLPT